MKKEAELVRDLGFTGKGSIHPKQINILNEIFTPSKEEIAKANDIDYNIYKYDGMGHTEILYFYTEEYSQLLTDFYKSTLSG